MKEALKLLETYNKGEHSLVPELLNPLLNLTGPHSKVQPVLALIVELMGPHLNNPDETDPYETMEGMRELLNLCSQTLKAQEEVWETIRDRPRLPTPIRKAD